MLRLKARTSSREFDRYPLPTYVISEWRRLSSKVFWFGLLLVSLRLLAAGQVIKFEMVKVSDGVFAGGDELESR